MATVLEKRQQKEGVEGVNGDEAEAEAKAEIKEEAEL